QGQPDRTRLGHGYYLSRERVTQSEHPGRLSGGRGVATLEHLGSDGYLVLSTRITARPGGSHEGWEKSARLAAAWSGGRRMARVEWSSTAVDWVSRLCQHDPAAWERFMRRRRPGIVTIGLRLGLTQAEADALANDLAFALFEQMRDGKFVYDGSRSFNGLLYTMARNRATDLLRKRG